MGNIILPELGEGIKEAVIACWHYKVGDSLKNSDDVVELVTDKASFNVQADCQGVLKEILVKEGQSAKVGEVLAIIEK